jgi:hypothetical protein
MTTIKVDSIGFCCHDSVQGDRAFQLALTLAQRLDAQLNMFAFLNDPYSDQQPRSIPSEKPGDRELLIRLEKQWRMRYDAIAGDFLNMGFRLCHDNGWSELHRCLLHREFQMLVLARPAEHVDFLGKPIEQFAREFISPTILVGPGEHDFILGNEVANLVCRQVDFPWRRWNTADKVASLIE